MEFNHSSRMRGLKPSDLLDFLSEPRSLKEVALHFGVPEPVARYYIQKEIEQDEILICKHSRGADSRSQKKGQHKNHIYISRSSNLLSRGLASFAATKDARAKEELRQKTALFKFSSKSANKSSLSTTADISDSKNPELEQHSFPRLGMGKERLVRTSKRRHFLAINRPAKLGRTKSLTASEKLALFTALCNRPLSYLDLHTGFDISKQTIKTFVKNGLIQESWGPRNIGVGFRLTEKGKEYLERLRRAAKLEKDEIKKASIRLKHRSL